MSNSPRWPTNVVGLAALSAIAVFTAGVLALLPSQRAVADTTSSFADLDGATGFNCNAGNAGYGRDPRDVRIINDLSRAMETRSNSAETNSLRMIAFRLRDGRIVAQGESEDRPFRPGEEIPSFSPDPRTPGLWTVRAMTTAVRVDPQAPLAEDGLRYVREHVPVRQFMQAAEAGKGDELLRMLGATSMRGRDIIILAPVPSNWERLEAFTMHPTVVVLR